MKRAYITPALSTVEMEIKGNIMITASEEWANPEQPDLVKGEFEEQEDNSSGSKNLWDEEW